MSELEPRHKALLEQFRTAEEPPPGQLDAVLDRVIASGPAPAAVTTLTLLKGGFVVLVVAVAASIPLMASEDPAPRSATTPAVEPVPVENPIAPPPQAIAQPAPKQRSELELRKPEAKPKGTAHPERPREQKAGVADEVALMGRIRKAIQSDESARALKLLSQHERRYPDGVFADERRVSQAEALCSSGKIDRGQKIASSFVTQKPSSPLARRARRACKKADKVGKTAGND